MKMRLQQAFFNSSQGPQHREIGFPISTDNASWGVGPNTEKLDFQFLQTMQVGVWAPTQRISKRNSTGNASWGVGPNTEKLDSQFLQTMQVGGAPTQKLTKSQLTIMCKLGWYNDKEILFL